MNLGKMDVSTVQRTHGRAGQHLCSWQPGYEMRRNTVSGGDSQTEDERRTPRAHHSRLLRAGRGDRRYLRDEGLRAYRGFHGTERRLRPRRGCGLSSGEFLHVQRREIELARGDTLRRQHRSRLDHAGQHRRGKVVCHTQSFHGIPRGRESEAEGSHQV